jgi:hypothetical protein
MQEVIFGWKKIDIFEMKITTCIRKKLKKGIRGTFSFLLVLLHQEDN